MWLRDNFAIDFFSGVNLVQKNCTCGALFYYIFKNLRVIEKFIFETLEQF